MKTEMRKIRHVIIEKGAWKDESKKVFRSKVKFCDLYFFPTINFSSFVGDTESFICGNQFYFLFPGKNFVDICDKYKAVKMNFMFKI